MREEVDRGKVRGRVEKEEREREDRNGEDPTGVAKSVMAGPCNRTKLDNAYLERPKKKRDTRMHRG